MKREFIQKLTYSVNNGGTLELIQRVHDGTVLIASGNGCGEPPKESYYIPAGDMVMLMNLYRYIKDNDIQNDFINPYGRNKES